MSLLLIQKDIHVITDTRQSFFSLLLIILIFIYTVLLLLSIIINCYFNYYYYNQLLSIIIIAKVNRVLQDVRVIELDGEANVLCQR